MIVVKLGGLKHALIADKHSLLLLDLGYEVQLRWLVPQFLTVFARLLLSFEGLLFLLDQHLFHLNFLIIICKLRLGSLTVFSPSPVGYEIS